MINIIEYRRRYATRGTGKNQLTPLFFLAKITENENRMTKREFVTKSGDTWEWDETEETRKAVEKLHETIRELEAKAPDYGVGK